MLQTLLLQENYKYYLKYLYASLIGTEEAENSVTIKLLTISLKIKSSYAKAQ